MVALKHDTLVYPRLQVDPQGNIILAILKEGAFTTGTCIGHTKDSKSKVPRGKRFTDWEVGGELVDYDGAVTITVVNRR